MMKHSAAIFLLLLAFGYAENETEHSGIGVKDFKNGIKTVLTSVVHAGDEVIKKFERLDTFIHPDCVQPPIKCPNVNVTFWYTTRDHQNKSTKISVSDEKSFENIHKNQFPWKIIIHGYTKSKDEIPNPELKEAYFKKGNYNLIFVDYEPLAREKCYTQAVDNVPLISKCTAQFIDALVNKSFVSMENVHVIGFSLGAQVSGQLYKYLENGKPGRVTGLDPASPLFDGFIHMKLSPKSGNFVDVIHTDTLIKGELDKTGHVDFYVNGGFNQPGCKNSSVRSVSSCSHNRSPLYYAESINSRDGFWGIPCQSYIKFLGGLCNTNVSELVPMGEYVPTTTRGLYYLETKDHPPFALGKQVKITQKN